jgi:NMD protein affecting ribosome stability and mRNA decay
MRRTRSTTHSAARQPRPARRVRDQAPGRARGKLREIAGCPDCGASYREGRWTWRRAPNDAYQRVCPACERIAGRYPAGVLRAEGAFAASHRSELIALVRGVEERECAEHPLKRVMNIERTRSGFTAETTDGKLARTLGRALHKAYAGRLVQPRTTAEKANLVRVRWIRD